MWEVNVKGPLRLIRLAMPYLKKSGSGRVVNVSSLSGKRVKNAHAGYAMSKFAVVALTHAVRRLGWERRRARDGRLPELRRDRHDGAGHRACRASEMIQPADLAELVATALALPNNAVVAELLVNCRLEDMFWTMEAHTIPPPRRARSAPRPFRRSTAAPARRWRETRC